MHMATMLVDQLAPRMPPQPNKARRRMYRHGPFSANFADSSIQPGTSPDGGIVLGLWAFRRVAVFSLGTWSKYLIRFRLIFIASIFETEILRKDGDPEAMYRIQESGEGRWGVGEISWL